MLTRRSRSIQLIGAVWVVLTVLGCGTIPHQSILSNHRQEVIPPVVAKIDQDFLETPHEESGLFEAFVPVAVQYDRNAPLACHPCAQQAVNNIEWKRPSLISAPGANSKLQQTSPSDSLEESIAAKVVISSADCLPLVTEWQRQQDTKSALLEQQFNSLQLKMTDQQKQLTKLEGELSASHQEIDRLKQDLGYYRREVLRLEGLMETQHSADLLILDALSQQLAGLLQQTNDAMSR